MHRAILAIAALILTIAPAHADLRVAVAANFAVCLEELAAAYADQGGDPLVIAVGSTGRHYAQIRAGAPFDVFLAADARRPALLEEEGQAVAGTRFTYAVGALVLWLPDPPSPAPTSVADALAWDGLRHLAVANPRLAPYGEAARQTIASLDLTDAVADCLVTGQTVGQALQFVASGNAEAGFVARSQLVDGERGLILEVAPAQHEPIVQQAVLLAGAADPEAAAAFLAFLRTDTARAIIQRHGYRTSTESS